MRESSARLLNSAAKERGVHRSSTAFAFAALVAACGGSAEGDLWAPGAPVTPPTSAWPDGGLASDAAAPTPVDAGREGGAVAPRDAAATNDASAAATVDASAPPSSGSIHFHLLLGVSGDDAAGDVLTLDGDNYTDLIMSNIIAGVMYGHLITAYTPGMQFNKEYLYGSLFGQLLQENISTESYTDSSPLIDSSPLQQAVMGGGQGGPYQINNYAADMVYGSYAPEGYSLINFVALQKNIGYSFAAAATQYTQVTPAPFNDKYYGPMLTAYFHFNDYVALQAIGPASGYTPGWEPAYDNALTNFKTLPGNFLDILLNAAYNQGYYGTLVSSLATTASTATQATLAAIDSYGAIWGVNDTYRQYPYQVRYYLDQLYDNPIPTTSVSATEAPTNHVIFGVTKLGLVFASVFQTLAYESSAAGYSYIQADAATAAYESALSSAGLSASAALDLSGASSRAAIFSLLEAAITNLETNLATDFTARTTTAP